MTEHALMALNNGWVEGQTTTSYNYTPGTTMQVGNLTSSGWYDWNWYHHYCYPITNYITAPARPIKLKLSEIDKLRKVAKADKALKEILEKFTHQIEITVDFE